MSGLFVVREMCSDREMSPIELVWDKLGRAVRKHLTLHSTLLNLCQLLLEEWVYIPQRYIQTLINSICDTVVRHVEMLVGPLKGGSGAM